MNEAAAERQYEAGKHVSTPAASLEELIRQHDWTATPLGAADGWPQSLRSALSICLESEFQIAIYWGPQLSLIYNDAWSQIPGYKHPWALGRPGQEVWPEIWDTIGPLFERVLSTGKATRSKDQLLAMHRRGFTEECYFDYTFSPIRDESGRVGGIFNIAVETTFRVVQERRQGLLRHLGEAIAPSRTAQEACGLAAEALASDLADLPFTLIYLADSTAVARGLKLIATSGTAPGLESNPPHPHQDPRPAAWPVEEVFHGKASILVENLSDRFGTSTPGGAWPEPCERALVLRLSGLGMGDSAGVLVCGISPRLELDLEYRSFLERVAAGVAASIANARAHEEERRRAEALAEIDRAKTQFFSNVSHEFRTPLTLLLGPLEDTLSLNGKLPPNAQDALSVAHRNGLRLLRLVNSLLDFSRIEAGRARAAFEPTDLATLTADLASSFRSATERAGLQLHVDCSPLSEPVWVDREMWEKVVLNLLSNAFKFTFEGAITVRLRASGGHAQLSVTDTGTGIPDHELPRLFERFHRVEGARGRTIEGSGIGLALVQELVRLHGGTIQVASTLGQGSAFTVSLPFGNAHLAADRLGAPRQGVSTALHAEAFVEEALRWLPDSPEGSAGTQHQGVIESVVALDEQQETILFADDNADMRDYVSRLLRSQYNINVCTNGEEALRSALADPPDLVLSDIMMPGLDGFGLLKALRAEPKTSTIPVILLSARAGEEARTEGMQAGADDYLVKPFSARELITRVAAHLKLARARREADEQARRILESITDAFIALDRDMRLTYVNAEAERIAGMTRAQMLGNNHWDLFPGLPDTPAYAQFSRAIAEGVPVEFDNYYPQWDRSFHVRAFPSADGGLSIFAREVTEQQRAQAALEDKDRWLGLAQRAGRAGVFDWHVSDNRVIWSPELEALYGLEEGTFSGDFNEWLENRVVPDDAQRVLAGAASCIAEQRTEYTYELRAIMPTGEHRWLAGQGQFQYSPDGKPVRFIGVNVDIHERKLSALNAEFLNGLQSPLMLERDPEALIRHVLQELTQHMNVDCAAFGQISPDALTYNIQVEHCDRRPTVISTENMADFLSTAAIADLAAGQAFAVDDVATDPRTSAYAEDYSRAQIRAFVNAPLVAGSGLKGLLSINSSSTRTWRDHEVRLLRSVGARLFPAVERARAEVALHEQQHFTESVIAGSPTLTYIYDLVSGCNVFISTQSTQILGYSPEEIQAMGADVLSILIHPDDAPVAFERLKSLRESSADQVVEIEYRMRRRDGDCVWLFSRDRIWKRDAQGLPTQIIGVAVDVTERKRAEEVAREQETRLAVAIRNVPLVVYTCDRDLRYTWMGKAHPSFAPDQIVGRRDEDLLPPADVRELTAFKRRVLEQERPERQDLSLAVSGREYHYDISAEPLRNRDGVVIGLIVAAVDITARKQQEEALRMSEERYRAAVRAVSSLIWTNNARGEMEGEQPGWAAFTGQTYEEYQGYGWSSAVHPEDAGPTVEAWNAAVAESRPFAFEHRVRRYDGVWRLFSIRALPILDEHGAVREWVGVHTDITEERNLLSAIRTNEQRLQIVTDNAKVGLVVVSPEHRYRFANKAYAEILGLPPSDLVGLRLADAQEQIRPPLDRAFAGESLSYELTLPARDERGSRRYVVTYEPGTDVDGSSVVVVVIFEISERVRAEEALAKQLRLTQSITDNATTALFIMDDRQHCVFMNPAAEKLTGYTLAETQGRPLHDVVHHTRPDGTHYPLSECPIDRAFPERNQAQGEEIFVHKDGSFYPVAFTASPMFEGVTTVGTVIEVVDIRERTRAEQALRESEARFRELAESMPQVVWTSTPDGTCDYINTRWTELTGLDLAGTRAGLYFDEMPPEDRYALESAFHEGIKGGKSYTVECRFKRRADGSFRWHLVRAVPVHDHTGEIRKWLGTSTDIDEQKRTEEELRRANLDLEQFAYSASHDLQEPLRNVAVYSQLFSRLYGTNLDGQAHQFLGYMTEGAQRMGRLVSDLLAYTQAARFDDDPVVPLESEAALKNALANLSQAAAEAAAKITYDALPVVAVRQSHLEQLLQNLIGNAIKYRKDTEAPAIHIAARRTGEFWEFSVKDNGIGIEPAFHSKVFGMFKRLHTNTSKYSGTGIGLAICQKIVERYGSRIWIESELGVGTVCRFTLPGSEVR